VRRCCGFRAFLHGLEHLFIRRQFRHDSFQLRVLLQGNTIALR
jgi:hypothetical protein